MADTLTDRELNRAMLARQMLLERQAVTPVEAISRLLAIQGQAPRAPFLGLWARLQRFDKAELLAAIHARAIVRATMMRGTLHLMTADDFVAFRSSLREEAEMTLPGGRRWTREELEPTLAMAREHFAEPQDFESLRERIEATGADEVRVRAYAARLLLPLVQASSDAAWGFETGGRFVLSDAWLGRDVVPAATIPDLIRRYLAAWGPATPGDFAAWSGLKGAAAHFKALEGELVALKDERKRTLYDLPDAPRPPADTPAPARLLPEFDAVVLGWQDRSRILDKADAPKIQTRNLLIPPVILVDGRVAGAWKLDAKKKTATIAIQPFAAISKADRAALEAEAMALLAAFEPAAAPAVTFA